MFRFVSVAPWTLLKKVPGAPALPDEGELRPVTSEGTVLAAALERVEYRGEKAADYARAIIASNSTPAVFARSPNDLPALLRTADQLLALSRQESGERAQLYQCSCGTRYAVPVGLMRPVAIRCQRCGATVEFDTTGGQREPAVTSQHQAEVNACRESLAEFFREAMARGWPVLIETETKG